MPESSSVPQRNACRHAVGLFDTDLPAAAAELSCTQVLTLLGLHQTGMLQLLLQHWLPEAHSQAIIC